jgi:hypothetical protein
MTFWLAPTVGRGGSRLNDAKISPLDAAILQASCLAGLVYAHLGSGRPTESSAHRAGMSASPGSDFSMPFHMDVCDNLPHWFVLYSIA